MNRRQALSRLAATLGAILLPKLALSKPQELPKKDEHLVLIQTPEELIKHFGTPYDFAQEGDVSYDYVFDTVSTLNDGVWVKRLQL